MSSKSLISRRNFTKGTISVLGLTLAGCTTTGSKSSPSIGLSDSVKKLYGALPNERFFIPAVNLAELKKLDPKFYRQRVNYETNEKVGTILVDTQKHFCYLVEKNGTAMRYGVGLGRAGHSWAGRAQIAWKRKWPTWTPPTEMIERSPELEEFSAANGGHPPGLDNPLGSRALYIFENGKDTLYRLHGTDGPASIGKSVSAGCVRIMNQDIVDLYDRVPGRAPLLVF